jgi:hypothetical protein
MQIPNVSVKVEIVHFSGYRLDTKNVAETLEFNVRARLEEKERRSQTVTVNFSMLVTSKPSIVKFEVDGTATINGKDEDIRKMLEIEPDTKVPYILPRIYQHAFTAMYLLSTILDTPPPPQDLLNSQQPMGPIQDVTVEVDSGAASAKNPEEAQSNKNAERKEPAAMSTPPSP